MIIYHNPRCSKSRQALQLLEDNNQSPEIRLYLKETLTFDELKEIIEKLGILPEALIRKNEAIYKASYKGKELSSEAWIQAMIDNPKLIERPIVVKENKAIIARPPEDVLSFIAEN